MTQEPVHTQDPRSSTKKFLFKHVFCTEGAPWIYLKIIAIANTIDKSTNHSVGVKIVRMLAMKALKAINYLRTS